MIRDIVHRVAPTARTILYGSEARGDARADSDIDLLILMDGEKLSLAQEDVVTLPLYELELKTGVAINPIVMTKYQWENRPFKTPFYVNVMNEGVVL
jgi:predicted nucleotidyltransferase